MKKTTLLLVAICLSAALQAAVTKTVSVATAGTLHTYFTVSEKTTLTDLTVTGTIDDRDFKFMRDTLNVSKLDLNAVHIAAYTGAGTEGASSIAYAANVVPQYAFFDPTTYYGKPGLTSINLPTTATSIESHAFSMCSGLTSVTIPPSVTSIGELAFASCSGLTSITIPNSVTSIGDYAFEICMGLTSVVIPTSVTSIGDETFYYCSNLTSVSIPTSVISFGTKAFESCTDLTSIYAYNPIPVDLSSSPYVFDNVNKTSCILHVPVGSKAAYKAAVQWQDFNIVEDLPASINNTTASKVKVSTQNGQAVVSGLALGETITIYNLQGAPIYNQPANADIVAVSLPAHGVYVVRVGAKSLKVVY